MFFGVDYYPEHWPEQRWSQDAGLMREAGFNVARLAEFAWAKMEPEKGKFDFTWLDRAIQTLAACGIKTVLGTPTASPPKWVMDESPDVYPEDIYGHKRGFGNRRHYCFNSPSYQEHSRRIIEAMASHYRDNENVIAWQIDNELMGRCYCQNCRTAFIEWLKVKYGSIDTLNSEWGTVFWSQTYRDWNELILPGFSACGISDVNNSVHNPGLELDFKRFSSDSILRYTKMQIDVLRRTGCNQPITHNMMPNSDQVDYYMMGTDLEFASWDAYPVSAFDNKPYEWISMGHALTRGVKPGFWVMEQESGPCGWSTIGDTPKPGQIRLWSMQSLANGAQGIVYFRWRASIYGTEQYWYGILDHDAVPRRRYREIVQTGKDIQQTIQCLEGAELVTDAAVVYSYDILWSHQSQKHNKLFEYKKMTLDFYSALLNNHIGADLIGETADLSKYKVVFLPAFCLMTDELRNKLENYVSGGGTLVVTFRSGIKNWNSVMTTETLPGAFRKMAGVAVEEFDSLNWGRKVKVSGETADSEAGIWCDVLKTEGAQVLARYTEEYYAGEPAITVNRFGKGNVYYFGCDLDAAGMKAWYRSICDNAGIIPALNMPTPGVEAAAWKKGGGRIVILLNHENSPVDVRLEKGSSDAFSGEDLGETLTLPAFGTAVVAQNG